MTTPAITTFYQDVDKRSRQAMTDFLRGHFRYDTMNSWNQARSYANNVKVTRVLPDDLLNKAFEVLEVEGAYDTINILTTDWDAGHNWSWQVAFNGRSGGYLVLYQGGREPSGHKRICRDCGQTNFRADATECGRCRSNNMHDHAGFRTFTYAGRGLDDDTDFFEWSLADLRDRVELIQDFDRLCDDVVAAFIELCESHEVVEETILVEKKVKVLR